MVRRGGNLTCGGVVLIIVLNFPRKFENFTNSSSLFPRKKKTCFVDTTVFEVLAYALVVDVPSIEALLLYTSLILHFPVY